MKVVGIWSGHDCSFCVLENGVPTVHAELERYNREKSPQGDAAELLFERLPEEASQIVHAATCHPRVKVSQYKESYQKLEEIVAENGGKVWVFPHHKAHAANAFYSSNFNQAVVITMDGGGVENTGGAESACTVWFGDDTKLTPVRVFSPAEINIGGVWTRVTRYIFKLQNGWPLGGQEGSVMAMAAFGDAKKYHDDFWKMLTVDKIAAGFKPPGQPLGAYVPGKDPVHPYLDPWAQIGQQSEQDIFDLAAGLQSATEELIKELLKSVLEAYPNIRNLCLSGGVTLNSVAMGKIKEWFPGRIDDIYIPPVPYDGGLSIGAAQILWHQTLKNPRIKWDANITPYLGEAWNRDHIDEVLEEHKETITVESCNIDRVVDLLDDQKIVSVFNGGSESGRRALGNRSILADPRSSDMKDIINKKVKHRQWFRPFAPSILDEAVSDWFVDYQESPYMQFVLKFREERMKLVPAVVHCDGTARLQTVKKADNEWYHNFLHVWWKKSGVPIILNTSFNDREPICENARHALKCFLGTEIDYLFFPEHEILVSRKA